VQSVRLTSTMCVLKLGGSSETGNLRNSFNDREHTADSSGITVKYHAYLRKMTRYNPTRGGERSPQHCWQQLS
jgi:hypothetical protein